MADRRSAACRSCIRCSSDNSKRPVDSPKHNRYNRPVFQPATRHFSRSGDCMTIRIPVRSLFVLACGVLLGVVADRVGSTGAIVPVVAAQQARAAAPPPTLESLAADVAQLKAIQPSNSHIMMDVQFHWTNLWF